MKRSTPEVRRWTLELTRDQMCAVEALAVRSWHNERSLVHGDPAVLRWWLAIKEECNRALLTSGRKVPARPTMGRAR